MNLSQAIITIARSKGFRDAEISRLSGIHRVTISNIMKGNTRYSGNTSEKKLLDFIKQVGFTDEEASLMVSAKYKRDKRQAVPSSQQKQITIDNQENFTISLRKITREHVNIMNASKIAMQWIKKYNVCTACNNTLGQTYSTCFINEDFAILCEKCTSRYQTYFKPIPKN